jgi:hypothetical protein
LQYIEAKRMELDFKQVAIDASTALRVVTRTENASCEVKQSPSIKKKNLSIMKKAHTKP